MNKIEIVNYSTSSCEPLRSITELTRDEAMKKAQELSSQNQGTSFRRFGKDFEGWYYDKRIKSEAWLYKNFKLLGGKPKTEHPLYFVVYENPYLNKWFDNGTVSKLDLATISDEDISFTFGDSMSHFQDFTHEHIFLKKDLIKLIQGYDYDECEFLTYIKEKCGYIEAQLWDKSYIKHTYTK